MAEATETKPSAECIKTCSWEFHEIWHPGYRDVFVRVFGKLGIPRMWAKREWKYCPNCGREGKPEK
ncbi:hypothetical protein LCGC14_1826610 [marine sediment metagenome]|uniref:Uncharacterized protein n=1 Tax=marine sediment metagenome TaxID=412755 RepID=A0A0F9GHK9_9ZZZZ